MTTGGMKRALVPCLVACAVAVAACGGQLDEEGQDVSLAVSALGAEEILPSRFAWETVANNATAIPDAGGKKFNSYNQPSVNGRGLVVFRARSKGSDGGSGETATLAAAADAGPVRGIFTRDMATRLAPGAIATLVRTGDEVPQPNNVTNPGPASFNEFPSIPAHRPHDADHRHPWSVATGPTSSSSTRIGSTTRIGTSGVYANPGGGPLFTGASLVGAAKRLRHRSRSSSRSSRCRAPRRARASTSSRGPGVAGALPGAAGSTAIVFKGNWTDFSDPANPVGRTGVYFRDVRAADAGGVNPVVRIADSATQEDPGARHGLRFHRASQRREGLHGVRGLRQRAEPHEGRASTAPRWSPTRRSRCS